MTDSQLIPFALPSGKSLEEPTLELLRQAHIAVRRGHPRECIARVEGFRSIARAVFLKPSQIPTLVAEGTIPLALTGEDTVIESGADVVTLATLAYSRQTNGATRCVLFGRGEHDGDFFAKPEPEYQDYVPEIISEYPRATEAFLKERGVNAAVIPCTGGAEALVTMSRYFFGVALVETGTSLRANNLGEIAEIFTSKTVLIANKEAMQNLERKAQAEFLAKILTGVVEARGKVYITMNAPVMRVEEIKKILPSLKSPTIQPLAEEGFCAISSVVPTEGINRLKQQLMLLGAEGIVEFDHSSIV